MDHKQMLLIGGALIGAYLLSRGGGIKKIFETFNTDSNQAQTENVGDTVVVTPPPSTSYNVSFGDVSLPDYSGFAQESGRSKSAKVGTHSYNRAEVEQFLAKKQSELTPGQQQLQSGIAKAWGGKII